MTIIIIVIKSVFTTLNKPKSNATRIKICNTVITLKSLVSSFFFSFCFSWIFAFLIIEGPLGRATPPPFYICFGTQGADWRNAACDAKLATAGGRHLADIHTTYPVLNRSRENTPWSRGPPRRQETNYNENYNNSL